MDVTKARNLVSALRNRLNDRRDGRYAGSVTQQQQVSKRESKVPFPIWLSRVHLPIPKEQNISQRTFESIRSLGSGDEVLSPVEVMGVDAEWIGFRQAVESSSDGIPEEERYKLLQRDVTTNVVLLHVHGGGFLSVSHRF